jgi:biopolymer transport protein ExbB/TolQ
MGSLLFPLAIVITIAFVVMPVVVTISTIARYKKVESAIDQYSATVRALIVYLERGQRPKPTLTTPASALAPSQPSVLTRLLRRFRLQPQAPDVMHTYNLADEFEDYLTVIREGATENERFIRFKRKNFKMHQELIREVELCRSSVETLPYLGILGTVLGFFFSPAVFAPAESTAGTPVVTVGGLVLALSSTAVALACLILIKVFYENRVIPQFIEFEHSLRVIEEYVARYGDLRLTEERKAPQA